MPFTGTAQDLWEFSASGCLSQASFHIRTIASAIRDNGMTLMVRDYRQ